MKGRFSFNRTQPIQVFIFGQSLVHIWEKCNVQKQGLPKCIYNDGILPQDGWDLKSQRLSENGCYSPDPEGFYQKLVRFIT
jgi:hypothetical protein